MTSFKDGIVANGYVVDIQESCTDNDSTGNEQLTVKISLILNKMSYLGMESLHELNITND
jgi:hypothetical protein